MILALTAVSLNPKYLSCVPFFIDYWQTLKSQDGVAKYIPKVLILAEKLPEELEPYENWCELFSLNSEVSPTFGSQVLRLLKPSLEKADFVITTDVDMFPMSDRLISKGLAAIEGGADFVVCRDVLQEGQYPICYNIASPNVWRRLTGIVRTEELNKRLSDLFNLTNKNGDYLGKHGGSGWFADQEYLYSLVCAFEHEGGCVAKLCDRETGHRRLDRLFTPFPLNWSLLPLVLINLFTDYHVHHPVSRHAKYVSLVMRIRNFASSWQRI
jgi:hypothetical protein